MNRYIHLYKTIESTKFPFTEPVYLKAVNGYTDIYAKEHQEMVQFTINKYEKYDRRRQLILKEQKYK